jgi:hypothetical protein
MTAPPVLKAMIATGELTFTMVGEFDPWRSLLRKLVRLSAVPPERPASRLRPRRRRDTEAARAFWHAQHTDLTQIALRSAKTNFRQTDALVERLADNAEGMRAWSSRLTADPSLRSWADARAADLERIGHAVGEGAPSVPDGEALLHAFDQIVRLATLEPTTATPGESDVMRSRLLRFGYGSPWYIEAGIALGSGTSLTALLFGLEKICGIDLEIRLRRAELKVKLEEAQRELARLRQHDEERLREWADREEEPESVDERVERLTMLQRFHGVDFFPWAPKQATLSDDD